MPMIGRLFNAWAVLCSVLVILHDINITKNERATILNHLFILKLRNSHEFDSTDLFNGHETGHRKYGLKSKVARATVVTDGDWWMMVTMNAHHY